VKSVGLITMHRVNNCGSALQAYATVRAVEKLGYQCTVIDYIYPSRYHLIHAKGDECIRVGRFRLIKMVLAYLGILQTIQLYRTLLRLSHASRAFRDFAAVKMTRPLSREMLRKHPPMFDVYLTGSDQTWNPRYLADDRTFLLEFAPNSARRVAYAASFGCRSLPVSVSAEYAYLLSQYTAISVREPSGVDIIANLTGQRAVDVVDPTLLLLPEDWNSKASSTYAPKERFIFAYLLSYVFNPYPGAVSILQKLSRELKAKVVVYADGAAPYTLESSGFIVLRDNRHFLRPDEFLEYIKNAIYVVTTSFHGTAFSVNFRKDFYALINPNVSVDDRVCSFLDKVGLSDRGVKPEMPLEKLPPIETDYSRADGVISEQREKSFCFLRNAIEGLAI